MEGFKKKGEVGYSGWGSTALLLRVGRCQTPIQEEGNCGNGRTFLEVLAIKNRQRLLDHRFFQGSFFRSHRLESRNSDLNHIRVRLTCGQALEPKIWGDQRFRPGVAQ